MRILRMRKARQMAVATFGTALCVAGLPGYGAAAGTGQDVDAVDSSRGHGAADMYHIVNLVPGLGYGARINTRGQAAYQYVSLDGNLRVGFFNGERMTRLTPPTSVNAQLAGMNEKGEVAITAAVPFSGGFRTLPFRWSPMGGFTALPILGASGDNGASDINDHGSIVGYSNAGPDEGNYRAVRWDAANGLATLPVPTGFGLSFALHINEHGSSVGFAHEPAGASHALVWDAGGRLTDLGTLGGTEATGLTNNNRGEIAGMLNVTGTDYQAFLWNRHKGLARAGLQTVPDGLNNAGELVGRINYANTNVGHAFVFSRARGLVDLHRAPFTSSSATQANDKGTVIGEMSNYNAPGADYQRAYRWSGNGEAVDLNTRLLDLPQGLVVTAALRISPRGDIVANSNAGLVLLRRGGGTDAPVLGPVSIPETLRPGQPFSLTLSFRDRNKGDIHRATVDWGDGSGPQPAGISERMGSGHLSAAHAYARAGDYNIVVRVTDTSGRTTLQSAPVSFLSFPDCMTGIAGEGSLPAAAGRAGQATLVFRLAAPLASVCGDERPFTFSLQGRVAFKGERLERVSRNGNTVTLEGTGTLGGKPGYRFRIEARDGQHGGTLETDRMTVRIEHAEPMRGGSAAGMQPAVFSYGVAENSFTSAPASREGNLAPAALRLVQ